MSSMYEQFKTDKNLELNGVDIDYGSFVVTVLRAGGSNKKFTQIMAKLSKPHRRMIQAGSLDEEVGKRMLAKALIDAIIINWCVRKVEKDDDGNIVKEELVKGVEGPDGDILPYSRDNIMQAFINLPDLPLDIYQQASDMSIFKETLQEEDSLN